MDMDQDRNILIPCPAGKRVYFASDFHLGAPDQATSLEREQAIVRWLDAAQTDAAHIFLVGDIFDFWFEYKKVIPKGYTRLLGKLAELSDKGIGVSVFTGNHDMWMDGYFEEELHIRVFTDPQAFRIADKRFFIAHGDGLGPGDRWYKLMKKVFRSKLCRALFAALHPGWGIAIANTFSKQSRLMTEEQTFLGEDREWLVQFSKDKLKEEHFDYFIFGHRHLPLDIPLSGGSHYLNLGDWLHHYSYAVFDSDQTVLCYSRPGKSAQTAPALRC
ncbi:MAG TPA: UDP-2,3-diacylglucosamine diphosphatase [Chitinophagaceae bacterium]|nr:UDP-2,3-diacylglucosamine diphosphatase [Chitinophagaceae bacterium]